MASHDCNGCAEPCDCDIDLEEDNNEDSCTLCFDCLERDEENDPGPYDPDDDYDPDVDDDDD